MAYDRVKGRVWVLCTKCRNWNLVPVEERWEIVDDADRLFEKAAIGASTEHVSLGRLRCGLEMLRIGRIDRLEFAGWRYGDRITQRRKFWNRDLRYVSLRSALFSGAGVGGVLLGLPWAPVIIPAGLAVSTSYDLLTTLRDLRRPLISVQGTTLTKYQASLIRMAPGTDDMEWCLVVKVSDGDLMIQGSEAVRLLRAAMPQINQFGSSAIHVRRAVDVVETVGSPDEVFRSVATRIAYQRAPLSGGRTGYLNVAPMSVKLAVEIAANEEAESKALQGELQVLEAEWGEAEQLATISDNLLTPRHVNEWIARTRTKQAKSRHHRSNRGQHINGWMKRAGRLCVRAATVAVAAGIYGEALDEPAAYPSGRSTSNAFRSQFWMPSVGYRAHSDAPLDRYERVYVRAGIREAATAGDSSGTASN